MARNQSTEIRAELVASVLRIDCEVGDTVGGARPPLSPEPTAAGSPERTNTRTHVSVGSGVAMSADIT